MGKKKKKTISHRPTVVVNGLRLIWRLLLVQTQKGVLERKFSMHNKHVDSISPNQHYLLAILHHQKQEEKESLTLTLVQK